MLNVEYTATEKERLLELEPKISDVQSKRTAALNELENLRTKREDLKAELAHAEENTYSLYLKTLFRNPRATIKELEASRKEIQRIKADLDQTYAFIIELRDFTIPELTTEYENLSQQYNHIAIPAELRSVRY